MFLKIIGYILASIIVLTLLIFICWNAYNIVIKAKRIHQNNLEKKTKESVNDTDSSK